jgi:hypothetical protein
MRKIRTFEVFWSDEDESYVGLCKEHPGLIVFEDTEEETFHTAIDIALAMDEIEEESHE